MRRPVIAFLSKKGCRQFDLYRKRQAIYGDNAIEINYVHTRQHSVSELAAHLEYTNLYKYKAVVAYLCTKQNSSSTIKSISLKITASYRSKASLSNAFGQKRTNKRLDMAFMRVLPDRKLNGGLPTTINSTFSPLISNCFNSMEDSLYGQW